MGLSASVFTSDPALGRQLASAIDAGGVNVNDVMLGAAMAAVPFGGIKDSGYGRLQGIEGFRAFSQSKAVTQDRVPGMKPMMSMMLHMPRQPSAKLLQRALKLLFGRGR
jgi:acyl-CoA reductase-like NAD-dependent aldehyde dehydrogenase